MEGITQEEKPVLIGKVLMPNAILESVAAEYGITKQRVGAIFKSSTDQSYSKVKKELKTARLEEIASKIRCTTCGGPIPIERITGQGRPPLYCTADCRKIALNYDLDHVLVCEYEECNNHYFLNRNWRKSHMQRFCCMDHYIKHLNTKTTSPVS